MDIEKMRTFLTVVETGSFVETSEALYMTPSTVSKHVAALEGELGIQLLMRNARQVTLTEDGQSCIAEIRSIVDLYDVLRQKQGKMIKNCRSCKSDAKRVKRAL